MDKNGSVQTRLQKMLAGAHHLNVLLLRVGDVLHRHTQWICCHLALEVGIGGAHGWQEGLEAVEDCGA